MRRAMWMVLVVMVAITSCQPAVAAEHEWSVLADNDAVQGRVALWEGERTCVGPFAAWDDVGNVFAGGVFATYDVMHEQEFQVLSVKVPATVYVGGMIGGQDIQEPGALVALLTGIEFGDERTTLGFEIQRELDQDVLGWGDLTERAEGVDVFFRIAFRF